LRDDPIWPTIALGPEDVDGRLVAHDGVIDPAQHLPFNLAERQRVAAMQVLPGKEQRFGPDLAGLPHGQPRRQVVRLFVDVDDVGPELGQAAGQIGEVVDVVAAVEANRLDEQLIPRGEAALEGHRAAGVVPTRRHDGKQFHAGDAGDGFQLGLIGAHQQGLGEHEYAHELLDSSQSGPTADQL